MNKKKNIIKGLHLNIENNRLNAIQWQRLLLLLKFTQFPIRYGNNVWAIITIIIDICIFMTAKQEREKIVIMKIKIASTRNQL